MNKGQSWVLIYCTQMTGRDVGMGWLWLVGSIKLQVSFAKEPYKRDNILQKRPIILSILLTVATPYVYICVYICICIYVYRKKYVYIHMNLYMCKHICVYIYKYVYMYMYMYVCKCIHVYVKIHIYIYI